MRRVRVLPVAVVALGAIAAAVVIAANGSTIKSAAARPPFYGVGLSRPPSDSDYAKMAAGGVRTGRFVIDWRQVQPGPDGGYRWGHADRYMRGIAKHGLEPLPLLFATPGWLAPSFIKPPLSSARARSAWRGFVHAAVARFGPEGTFWTQNPDLTPDPVHYWQIWNEQNSPDFWAPDPSPREYTKLLKITAKTLRATDPGARIVLGGMFEGNVSYGAILSWKYLDRLYELGAAPYFDVVGAHPYSPKISAYEFQVRRLAATIRRHGHRGTPIWIDEIGWGSGRGGSPLNKGPEGQARMLRRAFRFAARNRHRLDVRRILWYPWRDAGRTPEKCAFCGRTGLRQSDGSPKPSWRAFHRLALPQVTR
jgi:polysaccharide biosynthesis protein PslG